MKMQNRFSTTLDLILMASVMLASADAFVVPHQPGVRTSLSPLFDMEEQQRDSIYSQLPSSAIPTRLSKPQVVDQSTEEVPSSPNTLLLPELSISSEEELEDFIHTDDDRVTVVKFYASWCKSCARLALKMKRVHAEHADKVDEDGTVVEQGDMRFAAVEWGASEELCIAQGVSKLPTTRYYVNGELQKEIFGGAKKFKKHQSIIDNLLLQSSSSSSSQLEQEEKSLENALHQGSAFMDDLILKRKALEAKSSPAPPKYSQSPAFVAASE